VKPLKPVEALPNGFVKLGLAPELLRAVADLGYTQPTLCKSRPFPWPCPRAPPGEGLHRPDGLQPDRQRQDRRLPAARAAHPADPASPSRSRRTRRVSSVPWPKPPPRASPHPSAPSARTPPTPATSRPPRPGALIVCPTRELAQQVAHDAIGLVQALPWPARGQHRGRHALPTADCQVAKRRPRGGHPWPPAGPATLDADQARQGAVPGGRRSRPHARPGLLG
jgi:hypothetical protein